MEGVPIRSGREHSQRARPKPSSSYFCPAAAQLDSFDLKPDAPSGIRGEFRPIATRTPGIRICEHLPLLAARMNAMPWSVR